jgi:hypothetical protein
MDSLTKGRSGQGPHPRTRRRQDCDPAPVLGAAKTVTLPPSTSRSARRRTRGWSRSFAVVALMLLDPIMCGAGLGMDGGQGGRGRSGCAGEGVEGAEAVVATPIPRGQADKGFCGELVGRVGGRGRVRRSCHLPSRSMKSVSTTSMRANW